jgi:Flp pilus assembly protein TadG
MTEPVTVPRRRVRADRGLTLVLVALLTVVILMMAALAIDGGVAYQTHRQSQNAADSGAMAGARALEKVKFFPICSALVPAPCTTFTTNAAIRDEILREAQQTGADTAAAGVQCYLLDANKVRVGPEFCASNIDPTSTSVALAFGVEVRAVRTRATYFAKVAGYGTTAASGTAKAFVFNFVGGTGSPFVTCGVSGGVIDPSYSYNLVAPNGFGGYSLVSGAVGAYYQIQGSQNPTCGAASNTFKGKSDGNIIPALPYDVGITTGNGFSNQIQVTVAGLKPCAAGATVFDGCGMLIPIADRAVPGTTGTATKMHVVTWLAFQVWGSGNSYSFAGSNSDPIGTSCGNPITPGGSMKYCGKLLGTASVTGGKGSGIGTVGLPHILYLSQ